MTPLFSNYRTMRSYFVWDKKTCDPNLQRMQFLLKLLEPRGGEMDVFKQNPFSGSGSGRNRLFRLGESFRRAHRNGRHVFLQRSCKVVDDIGSVGAG